MTTGRQLVTKAMQKIGLLTKTETPSADELADGLYALNAMLETWSNDASMVVARLTETFPLTAGVASYTIGPAATWSTVRPIFIVGASVRNVSIDYEMTSMTDEDYLAIPDKSFRLELPQLYNYNNGFALGTVTVYPTPDQNYQITLLSEKPINSVTVDADVSFPPGWEEAIIYNLPVRLAPEYGQPVTPDLAQMAQMTYDAVETSIRRNRTLDVPLGPSVIVPSWRNGYFI